MDPRFLTRVERTLRDHPDWSWSEAAQHVTDQTDEYAAEHEEP